MRTSDNSETSKMEKVEYKSLPRDIRSKYLDEGVNEGLVIRDVTFDLETRTAQAVVDVETNFTNSYEGDQDNSYHWSAITAYRALSQIAIGFICTDLGKKKREVGEVMQISSTMNTQSPITQTKGVPVKVKFVRYIQRPTKILGELSFDVAENRFHGTCRFRVNL